MIPTNGATSITWDRGTMPYCGPKGSAGGCGGDDDRYWGVVRYTILIPQHATNFASLVAVSHPDCFDLGIFGGDRFNLRHISGPVVAPPLQIEWMVHAGSSLCERGCDPEQLTFDDVPTFFGKTFLVGANLETATTRTGRLADIQGDRVNAYLVRARVVPPAGGSEVAAGITLSFTRGACGGAGLSVITGGLIG